MLDSESSLRLNLLRFPLIVGVVFIHAYVSTVGLAGSEVGIAQTDFITDFVRNFISSGVARIAVPLFFLMSGYLFFFDFEWSIERYFVKLRRRLRTLLIPFLFWNIATLSIIALAQAIPATQTYFSGKNPLVASFGAFDYTNAIIGFDRSPISYQFWFIRDLMILVLLVPVLNIVHKVAPLSFLAIIFISWFLSLWPIYAPSSEAVLFFCLGAYFSSAKRNLFCFDKHGAMVVLLYFAVVILDALFNRAEFNPYLHKLGIILGLPTALFLSKYIAKTEKVKSLILWLSSASFFVYAVHEPLLTILKKIAYKAIIINSSPMVLAVYFLVPLFTIVFSVVVYRFLLHVVPKFVGVVTGGR